MNKYLVQITCVKTFEIEAETADDAEHTAYKRFDAAAFGNYNTDEITLLGETNED